jgi:hypothetical protein
MDDNKVAVLLEDFRAQFRTFGEGLQLLNDKVDQKGIFVYGISMLDLVKD